MKRIIIYLLFVASFCSGLAPAQTVHITKTGEKYHRAGCRYLKQSDNAIELKDALSSGYEACKICKPPQTINLPEKKAEERTAGSAQDPAASVQCSGTTQKGARCKRMTRSRNGLCWQHGG
jgi:hypothetical protein